MAFSLRYLNPLNWRYERLKDGSHWYTIGSDSTSWDNGDKLECLLKNPVAFRCVDIIADKLAQVKFKIDGEDAAHPLIDILENPNPYQSKQDFLKEFIYFKYAYGWVYQKPVIPIGFKKSESLKHLYNLNPSKVEFPDAFSTRLEKSSEYNKSKKRKFSYKEDEQEKVYEITDIIPFFDVANGLSDDFMLKAPSRLDSIQKQIKNMDVAAEALQRSMKKAGRFILTGENAGSLTNTGLGQNEKEDISKALNGFGLGNQKDVIPTTAKDVKLHSMHIPANQLGFNESAASNAMIILNTFGVPRELYPIDKSGATYENQKEAQISLVQNVIQVEADDLINTYKSYFKINEDITASFEHLPEMQHTETLKADKMLKISAAFRNIAGTGVTEEQLMEMAGYGQD